MSDSWSGSRLTSESAARDVRDCLAILRHVWPADVDAGSSRSTSADQVAADYSGDCSADGHAAPGIAASGIAALQATDGWSLPERFDRFALQEVLGQGGFGIVFKAYDPTLQRIVALKLPRPEYLASPEARRRFLREAEAVAMLDHPGIVPVYETGELPPVPYIVAAYCAGPTIAEWLAEQAQPAAPRLAAEWVLHIAEAVYHAHCRGVLHRDLTPKNVILEIQHRAPAAESPSYVPRLTDFGLAKRLGNNDDPTRTGALVGTLRYMAPEQVRGDSLEVTVASDVYGLGAILYELLTGHAPIAGESDAALLRNIEDQLPLSTRHYRPEIPRDLDTICVKCLAKSPADRYATARGLADDLRCFLAGAPVVARPLNAWQRAARWCRRRPLVAGLLVTLGWTLVAAFAAVTIMYRREYVSRLRADRNEQHARQAVNDMYLHAANQWLPLEPKADGIRLQFLRKGLAFYEALAAENPDDDKTAFNLTVALHHVANLLANQGEPDAAVEHRQRCLELLQRLLARSPDDRQFRFARFHNQLLLASDIARTSSNDMDLRLAVTQEALATITQLTLDFPADATYREARASAGKAVGGILLAMKRYADARSVSQDSAALSSKLLAEHPGNRGYLLNYLGQLMQLGDIGRASDDFVTAERVIEEALQRTRQALEKSSHDLDLRIALADVLLRKAWLSTRRQQAAEADAAFRELLATTKRIMEDNPHTAVHYQAHVEGALEFGLFLHSHNRPNDAKAAFTDALATLEQGSERFPNYPIFKSQLLNTLRDCPQGNRASPVGYHYCMGEVAVKLSA